MLREAQIQRSLASMAFPFPGALHTLRVYECALVFPLGEFSPNAYNVITSTVEQGIMNGSESGQDR